MMKVYKVSTWDEEYSELVWAETNNKARSAILGHEQFYDYTQIRAVRAPEFDKYKRITEKIKLKHGWWHTCPCCHRRTEFDDAVFTARGSLKHCVACKGKRKSLTRSSERNV